jgi:hypothetical protein
MLHPVNGHCCLHAFEEHAEMEKGQGGRVAGGSAWAVQIGCRCPLGKQPARVCSSSPCAGSWPAACRPTSTSTSASI